MSMKKFLISALAAVCAVSLLTPAAYAHGGCHGRSSQSRRAGCAVCTVEGCDLTGRHSHGRTAYCGYDHEDGWCDGSCAPLCAVEGCDLSGRHVHDGTVYCGYGHEDGWCDGACLALCTVEGCSLTGRHSHGGTACCGSDHESGFCDGSCPVYRSSSHGHHGGCH